MCDKIWFMTGGVWLANLRFFLTRGGRGGSPFNDFGLTSMFSWHNMWTALKGPPIFFNRPCSKKNLCYSLIHLRDSSLFESGKNEQFMDIIMGLYSLFRHENTRRNGWIKKNKKWEVEAMAWKSIWINMRKISKCILGWSWLL